MKTKFMLAAVICLAASLANAKDKPLAEKGKLAEMEAVPCGTEDKDGGGGLKETVLGTDSNHRKQQPLLCQEYVLQSDRMEYRIRVKDEKHAVLLPVGETAEFQLKKDYMLLRVPEMDSKVRQYFVMSMMPRGRKETDKTATNAEK